MISLRSKGKIVDEDDSERTKQNKARQTSLGGIKHNWQTATKYKQSEIANRHGGAAPQVAKIWGGMEKVKPLHTKNKIWG